MNTQIPLQPAIPRRQHDMNYVHPQSHPPQYYQGYPHPYPPPHFSQQWYPPPYQHMGMPMSRPYQHYPPIPMVNNAPYPTAQRNQTPLHSRPQLSQHAPSSPSMHSHQGVSSPAPSNTSLSVPPSTPSQAPHRPASTPPPPPIIAHRMPYYPPVSRLRRAPSRKFADLTQLPWYSFSEGSFPAKGPRRRRKRAAPQSSSVPVELPSREDPPPVSEIVETEETPQPLSDFSTPVEPTPALPILETPALSYDPSDTDSTQPTTPSSAAIPAPPRPQQGQPAKGSHRSAASITTIIPAIPNLPLPSRPSKQPPASIISDTAEAQPSNDEFLENAVDIAAQAKSEDVTVATEQSTPTGVPPAKEPPKSWADLVRTMAPPKTVNNGAEANSVAVTNGFAASKTSSLPEALSSYNVAEAKENSKIAFLEPRGLVNTGNMCYMNSVSPDMS